MLNVVFFLLGNSPLSEFYVPTFRNILLHFYKQVGVTGKMFTPPMKMELAVFRKVDTQNSHAGE